MIKMKKLYNKTSGMAFMLLCLMVVSASDTMAQIITGNAFLQGSYVEVGVAPCGRFGTTVGAPAAYHPRPGTITGGTGVVARSLGFVADFQADGWNVGNPSFAGDYFIPSNPEEGFSVRFNGSVLRNGIGFSFPLWWFTDTGRGNRLFECEWCRRGDLEWICRSRRGAWNFKQDVCSFECLVLCNGGNPDQQYSRPYEWGLLYENS
jgi:hypothetical protein